MDPEVDLRQEKGFGENFLIVFTHDVQFDRPADRNCKWQENERVHVKDKGIDGWWDATIIEKINDNWWLIKWDDASLEYHEGDVKFVQCSDIRSAHDRYNEYDEYIDSLTQLEEALKREKIVKGDDINRKKRLLTNADIAWELEMARNRDRQENPSAHKKHKQLIKTKKTKWIPQVGDVVEAEMSDNNEYLNTIHPVWIIKKVNKNTYRCQMLAFDPSFDDAFDNWEENLLHPQREPEPKYKDYEMGEFYQEGEPIHFLLSHRKYKKAGNVDKKYATFGIWVKGNVIKDEGETIKIKSQTKDGTKYTIPRGDTRSAFARDKWR
jgi:hypothetical protein